MARPQLLIEEQIERELIDVPLWSRDGGVLIREFALENFAKAIGLVNSVALLAEKADHHPDIMIYGWNKVRIKLSTHDAGGLTELDFSLAKKIEDLRY